MIANVFGNYVVVTQYYTENKSADFNRFVFRKALIYSYLSAQ